ncbi:MAG TPA: hypothetical protein PK636_10950, partial [bacterium]|nr:hypothetical protein [bacterium]
EQAAAVLDREGGELRKSCSLAESYRDVFRSLLDELQSIEEERWQAAEVKENLDRALAALTRARIKYDEGRGRIAALSCGEAKREIVIPPAPAGLELPGPWELFWRGFFLFLPAAVLAAAVIFMAGKLR